MVQHYYSTLAAVARNSDRTAAALWWRWRQTAAAADRISGARNYQLYRKPGSPTDEQFSSTCTKDSETPLSSVFVSRPETAKVCF